MGIKNSEVTLDDLFARWSKDVGYNKAVLISCCYPLDMVLKMSEEDAESEVEAIEYSV